MGHVDAGKSTMGGNILYLTGSIDKKNCGKVERKAKDAGRFIDTNKKKEAVRQSSGKSIF